MFTTRYIPDAGPMPGWGGKPWGSSWSMCWERIAWTWLYSRFKLIWLKYILLTISVRQLKQTWEQKEPRQTWLVSQPGLGLCQVLAPATSNPPYFLLLAFLKPGSKYYYFTLYMYNNSIWVKQHSHMDLLPPVQFQKPGVNEKGLQPYISGMGRLMWKTDISTSGIRAF